MITLLDAPESAAIAARFGVPPEIHSDDFLCTTNLKNPLDLR